MKSIDKVVRRETLYIAAFTLILSVLMEAVFLAIGYWDLRVLLGNLLGGAAAIANFLLMGITVQLATESDEKDARNKMKLSQSLRALMLFAVAALGCILDCFNTAAVLIPLFFPRVAIIFRPLIHDGNSND